VLREIGQVDYEKKQRFRVAIYADGEKTNNEDDELVLRVYSPLHLKLEEGLSVEDVELESFSHPNIAYWLSRPDEDIERHIIRLYKLREAIRIRQARPGKTDDEKELLREKNKKQTHSPTKPLRAVYALLFTTDTVIWEWPRRGTGRQNDNAEPNFQPGYVAG